MNQRLASEMHNASFNIRALGDGQSHITFIDPFTNEQFSPDRVPTSIETQPHLREGLDYLRSRSADMELFVYGAPHGDGAVHDMQELIDTFQSHDAIFLEGMGHDAQQRDAIWDISAGNKQTLTDDEAEQFNPYAQRKFAALLRQNKPVFFADVPGDGGNFEQSFLEWDNMLSTLKKMIDGGRGDPKNLNLAMGINLTATTILREWYMLASMGRELKRLDDAGYKSNNPMFLVGTVHAETLPAKASVLGVNTSVNLPRMHENGERRPLAIPFNFVRAVGSCAVKTEF
jgi:hypothetical protein